MLLPIFTARKRSFGQGNIFTSVCQEFCSQGGLPHCMLGYHPLARQTPWKGRPPWQGDPPRQGNTPLGKADPPARRPLLRSACWEIRSTSGRYASYWNVILSVLYVLAIIILLFRLLTHVTRKHSKCAAKVRASIAATRCQCQVGVQGLGQGSLYSTTKIPVLASNTNRNLCCCRPQRSCGKVMFFTCLSFCSQGGVCLSEYWDTPPGQVHPLGQVQPPDRYIPLSRYTPWQVFWQVHSPTTVTAVDGTHPTGMLSCYEIYFVDSDQNNL